MKDEESDEEESYEDSDDFKNTKSGHSKQIRKSKGKLIFVGNIQLGLNSKNKKKLAARFYEDEAEEQS